MPYGNRLSELGDRTLIDAVIEIALDCIVLIDQQGLIIEMNEAAINTFGYGRGEAIGAQMADLIIPPDLRDAHRSGMQRYLSTGETRVLNQRIEVPAINKAGEKLDVELTITPIEIKGDKHFLANLRDVTEAKDAVRKLRASEERFQSLFDLSPDAIVVMDGNGRIVDVNNSACEMGGYSKAEMLSKSAFEFVPPDQLSAAIGSTRKAYKHEAVRMEIEFISADGGRIPTEVVGKRIETSCDVLYHGVVRDMSGRVEAERQLRAAKDEAEQANRAKTDFLANMSHEMRTPLNGVIGSLSLVRLDKIDQECAHLVQAASRSAESLLTLIDDLLDLSRIEAGEIEVEPVCFHPKEVMALAEELFSPLAEEKGISLSSKIKVPDLNYRADAGKIRQILLNLVGNAVKFTQRGSVDVSVKLANTGLNQSLVFSIEDTGIGISDADQALLFDRFKQADSSRSKAHGGAGLGLAICRELAEILDGSIALTSEPGIGSVFTFSVPVSTCAAGDKCLGDETEKVSNLSGRVLIAEDSETNAMVAKTMLRRIGLDFKHVADGAAAVDAALNEPFDVVLMDVSMPVLDGLEATRILRERGYKKPIIAMTAHALKGDRDRALESGMVGYVTKPVRVDALGRALAKWLPTPTQSNQSIVHHGSDELLSGIDAATVDELWSDDTKTFAEIAEIFLGELSWRLPCIESAKPQDLEHHAHSLKGAAANVGAMQLSQLSAQLEVAAISERSSKCLSLIKAISIEAGIVRSELNARYLEKADYE